jgi:hypothetical protein
LQPNLAQVTQGRSKIDLVHQWRIGTATKLAKRKADKTQLRGFSRPLHGLLFVSQASDSSKYPPLSTFLYSTRDRLILKSDSLTHP